MIQILRINCILFVSWDKFFSGMPQPNLYCAAGYFCRRNATSATPDQGDDANICPVGHYCPEGTGEPMNCPLGTFGNDTGLFDQSYPHDMSS